MSMIKEHERVILTESLADHRLEAGGVGCVVHIYQDAEAYEVEFITLDGKTAVVATIPADKVRPVGHGEIPHAREMVGA